MLRIAKQLTVYVWSTKYKTWNYRDVVFYWYDIFFIWKSTNVKKTTGISNDLQ